MFTIPAILLGHYSYPKIIKSIVSTDAFIKECVKSILSPSTRINIEEEDPSVVSRQLSTHKYSLDIDLLLRD